jgi:hypothetical protein
LGKEYDYTRLPDGNSPVSQAKESRRESKRPGIVALATISLAAVIGYAGYSVSAANRKADLALGKCFANRLGAVGIADQRQHSDPAGGDPSYRVTFTSGIRSIYNASELTPVPCPPER